MPVQPPSREPMSYAAGVRMAFAELPAEIGDWIAGQLGAPLAVVSDRRGGFSPGVAAVVGAKNGSRAFVKAVNSQTNEIALKFHHDERQSALRLPVLPQIPRPTGWLDQTIDGDLWAVTLFPAIDGQPPHHPWNAPTVERVLNSVVALGRALTPSPWPYDRDADHGMRTFFTGWQRIVADEHDPWHRHAWIGPRLADFAAREQDFQSSLSGNTLSHYDLRADNIVLSADQVYFVDWAHPRNAAAWLDPLLLLVDIIASGADREDGGELDVNHLLREHPAFSPAPMGTRWSTVICLAGALHAMAKEPSPPGLPTLRRWQQNTSAAVMAFVQRNL